MKIALLYGGQGAQREKMGLDFYENFESVRKCYDEMPPFAKETFELSMEELSKTHNTQRALLVYEMAVTKLLEEIDIDSVAGLSLGEYSALYACGVLKERQLWEIIEKRSTWMEEEGKKRDSLMIALRNADETHIKKLCHTFSYGDCKAELSNYNTKGQIVVSGEKETLLKMVRVLEEEKISFTVLPVSGAFHTSYMKPVEEKLLSLFQNYSFQLPKKKVYSNYLGRAVQSEEIPLLLARQVSHPVQFQSILENMLLDGMDTFIEISPREVLTKFVKKMDRKVKTYAITSVEQFKKCSEELL